MGSLFFGVIKACDVLQKKGEVEEARELGARMRRVSRGRVERGRGAADLVRGSQRQV